MAKFVGGPATNGFAITPANTAFSPVTQAIYVGTGGDVVIRFASTAGSNGQPVTFKNVPAGTRLEVQADIVYTTTTASQLVGMV